MLEPVNISPLIHTQSVDIDGMVCCGGAKNLVDNPTKAMAIPRSSGELLVPQHTINDNPHHQRGVWRDWIQGEPSDQRCVGSFNSAIWRARRLPGPSGFGAFATNWPASVNR